MSSGVVDELLNSLESDPIELLRKKILMTEDPEERAALEAQLRELESSVEETVAVESVPVSGSF